MISSFLLLILYPIVFLSSRECAFPIQTRQWCRAHIGVLPSGLSPGGFPWFTADFFGLQHHRNRAHVFIFSKLRMDLQTQIWDPGDSNYRYGNGELRLWISHLSGSCFVFESEIGFVVLFRSKTSVPFYIDAGILFHLLIISYRNSDINLRFGDEVALFRSDQIVASVHDVFVQSTSSPLAMFSSFGYVYTDIEEFVEMGAITDFIVILGFTWGIISWHFGMFGTFSRGFQTKSNQKSWDLFMVGQVLPGLSESFLRGDLSQSIGFKVLKICLLKGQMRFWESSIFTQRETMVINEQRCIRRFKKHDPEPFQATYQSIRSIKVMQKAFRSFIYLLRVYEGGT